MRRFLLGFALTMVIGLPWAGAEVPGESKADVAKEEAEKFEGVWKLVSLERDGKAVGEKDLEDVRLTFETGQYTYKGKQGERWQGSFKLDPAKKLRTIVTTYAAGPQQGKTLTRIYDWVDKDTLKFCTPGPREQTPDGFAAPQGSGRELALWKRDKPRQ